jgi:hypothetical protein
VAAVVEHVYGVKNAIAGASVTSHPPTSKGPVSARPSTSTDPVTSHPPTSKGPVSARPPPSIKLQIEIPDPGRNTEFSSNYFLGKRASRIDIKTNFWSQWRVWSKLKRLIASGPDLVSRKIEFSNNLCHSLNKYKMNIVVL